MSYEWIWSNRVTIGRSESPGGLANQKSLVEALRNPALWGSQAPAELLETHISYVLLTGQFAYKIKKPLNLAFLDFSTLEARRLYCNEEVRLNRRFAPDIYLDVVRITGTIDEPRMGGDGPVIEYAVKMREFAQEAILAHQLERGTVSSVQIDEMAKVVADFHSSAGRAGPTSPHGTPEEVLRLVSQNFDQVDALLDAEDRAALDSVHAWTEHASATVRDLMVERKADGCVRECHGDLHAGNIAIVDGRVTMFDCIEFNEAMRWIDVMSDVAFAVMDLQDRGHLEFGARFLSAYLEQTGDYAGLLVLRFYLVYRAMVRAKVSVLRAAQVEREHAAEALGESRAYLALALLYARLPRPAIVITHGLAGSGKSTFAQALVQRAGAIRIRTDVERKRLHKLDALTRTDSTIDGGLYDPAATEQVYHRARELARIVAAAGYVAIVDGAFLKREQRNLLRELAAKLEVPFVIVSVRADSHVLETRITSRLQRGKDASEADRAVLKHQIETQEPLTLDEQAFVVAYDSGSPDGAAAKASRDVLDRISKADS